MRAGFHCIVSVENNWTSGVNYGMRDAFFHISFEYHEAIDRNWDVRDGFYSTIVST